MPEYAAKMVAKTPPANPSIPSITPPLKTPRITTIKKGIKKYGLAYILQWIPFIGWLMPGDIVLVNRQLKGNFTSPEGILMLIIALFAYMIRFMVGIIEIFFSLGIFTTLFTWATAGFFATWTYIRGIGNSG